MILIFVFNPGVTQQKERFIVVECIFCSSLSNLREQLDTNVQPSRGSAQGSMSSSATRLSRRLVQRLTCLTILHATTQRQSKETMTFVSAGHIILTQTQPVGSERPQRRSNPGSPHQECRDLSTELQRPFFYAQYGPGAVIEYMTFLTRSRALYPLISPPKKKKKKKKNNL